MEETFYRLAEYQIILKSSGEIQWKAHSGFAGTKSGKCFIEGEVLFIGPSEKEEMGFLKSEFLDYLKQFPRWDKTKYYCPSYTLYASKGGRIQDRKIRKIKRETNWHFAERISTDRVDFIPSSTIHQIRQVQGKIGEVFRFCRERARLIPGKNSAKQ